MSGSNLSLPTETEDAARSRMAQEAEIQADDFEAYAQANPHMRRYWLKRAQEYRSRAASLRAGEKGRKG